jgi:hypothetical protein
MFHATTSIKTESGHGLQLTLSLIKRRRVTVPNAAQGEYWGLTAKMRDFKAKMLYVTGMATDPANKGYRIWYGVVARRNALSHPR